MRGRNKTEKLENTLANINRLFNGRNDAIKFIEEIMLSNLLKTVVFEAKKNCRRTNNRNRTWNDKFELPDGLYSVSDIQDYFEYNFKKHGANINNPLVKIYANKIKNGVTFKIKTIYSVELFMPETIKLLGSTENEIAKEKNGEIVPHLEITGVVLVHCNIVNNGYQQDPKVINTFAPNNHIFLKRFSSEFQDLRVCFTDQNSQPLEIEYRINLTLVIKVFIDKVFTVIIK